MTAVCQRIIQQQGIDAVRLVSRLHGCAARIVVVEHQFFFIRVGSVVEQVILLLQITPGEYAGFFLIGSQGQRRNACAYSELQPIDSTILEFHLLLEVRIAVDVLIDIYVRQRSRTAACHSRIGTVDDEIHINAILRRQRQLLICKFTYIRIFPRCDISCITIRCICRAFHQLGVTALLVERAVFEVILTENQSS